MAKSKKSKPWPEDSGQAQRDAHIINLIDNAGFIFFGTVLAEEAIDLLGISKIPERVKTVLVENILLSTDVLMGLLGRKVTVVFEDVAEIKEGSKWCFFTSCVSLGKQAILRVSSLLEDSPETAKDISHLIKIFRERPLLERVEGADLIITGKVVSSVPVQSNKIPKSEHDPQWWIARIKIGSVMKGKRESSEIETFFANSDDIIWFKSPKLHEKESGIFLLRWMKPREVVREINRSIYQVIDPLDFLPLERLQEIKALINYQKGEE